MSARDKFNGFCIIPSTDGTWWIECETCGGDAHYSTEGGAIEAAKHSECLTCNPKQQPRRDNFFDWMNTPIPFGGESQASEEITMADYYGVSR